jgi:MFS family permease
VFRERAFRDLLVAQSVSAFGDWMITVAMMALVLDLSGSSTAVAGILVLRLLPTAVAGPIVTRLVRRWDQRRTMLAMDVGRAVIVVLVPWVRALWWVYIWAFSLEVGGLVFLPARDSVVPRLVRDESQLEVANSALLASSYGLIPIGAAAFALLAAFVPGGRTARLPMIVVFAIDAVTFLVSYMIIRGIDALRDTGDRRGTEAAHPAPDDHRPFLHAFGIPLVRSLAGPAVVAAVGIGSLFSLGIVFVRNVLHATTAEFALLVALFGVGASVGLAVLRKTSWHGVRAARYAVFGQGLVIAGMSFAPTVYIAFAGAVGFGACTAVALTTSMTALQESLEGDERLAAFAVFHVLIRAGLALAAIGAGLAADLLRHIEWPLVGVVAPARIVLFGSGVVAAAAMALVHVGGRGSSAEDSGSTDAATVATSDG